jgi:hypothetical protein
LGRVSVVNVVDSTDYDFGIEHFRNEKAIPEKIKSHYYQTKAFYFSPCRRQ